MYSLNKERNEVEDLKNINERLRVKINDICKCNDHDESIDFYMDLCKELFTVLRASKADKHSINLFNLNSKDLNKFFRVSKQMEKDLSTSKNLILFSEMFNKCTLEVKIALINDVILQASGDLIEDNIESITLETDNDSVTLIFTNSEGEVESYSVGYVFNGYEILSEDSHRQFYNFRDLFSECLAVALFS